MKASTIFSKTMGFVWLKLGLGFGTFLISLLLLAICGGIGMLFHSSGALIVSLCIWIILTAIVNGLVNHYFGYLIRAGHVAVVSEALTTGQIPDCKFSTATAMVKSRFVATNVYFAINSLVNSAVRQLQNGVTAVDNLTGNIPVISQLMSFLKLFIGIALGYVDECCLGYTFYKKDENAFKASADGVVLYFQNWKVLMKSALLTSLIVAGLSVLTMLILFGIFIGLCAAFGASGTAPLIISLVLAIFLGTAIKSSFIDSYIMIKMMKPFMETAVTTAVKYDLYEKMCKFSRKFRELFEKGGASVPTGYASNPAVPL